MNLNESASTAMNASASEPAEHRNAFRRDVQGLRAIAVLAVMLFHACKTWLPGGFVGVDIFFVISGYIICSLIIDGKENFSWSMFYWGRVKRIVPAYSVMLAVVSIVSALLFIPDDFSFFKKSLESAALFFSNHYFANFGSYFAPGAYELPLLHTWSLAVEMQFYLFFPLFVLFIPRKYLVWLLTSLCVFLITYAEWQLSIQDNQRYVYYSSIARAPEFFLGALVAIIGAGRTWSLNASNLAGWTGLVLLALSIIYIDEQHFPGALSLLPCIATGLLIASREGVISRFLSTKSLFWVGGLSYSLYLWHWPILAFMRYYTQRYELTVPWLLAFFVLSFLLAWMSFRWVEVPVRNGKSFLAKPLSLVALLATTSLVMVASVTFNKLVEKKMPVESTRYAPPEAICHGQIVGDCLRGNDEGAGSVLVVGDSHAAQLNEFFDAVGSREDLTARVITASNCVPIPGFDVDRIPEYSRADCRAQIAALAPFVDRTSIIVIAAMWEWQAASPKFLRAFTVFLENATKRNVKVLVFAQIPMFDSNPLRVKHFSELGLPVRVIKNENWEKANNDIANIVSRYKGAEFVDFSHSDFFSEAPFYSGQLIYMDNHHLNEIGSREYGAFVAPFFKKLITSNH